MNKEEIIRMAREAHGELLASGRGMHVWHEDAYVGDVQAFCERFAALVAAHEREACAKVCEDIDTEYEGEDVLATWCAAAIRART